MAGTIVNSELSTSTRTRFAIASEVDDAAIRCLLRENVMPGAVSLTLEREPDYFRGARLAGAEDQTIVAFSNRLITCMGRCSWREHWVNGQATRVGYLAELRLDSAARGQFTLLREGYRFFHEIQQRDAAALYFTSIATGNQRARRFLERGVSGMPRYTFLSDLVTLLVPVPSRPRRTKLHLERATPERVPEILRVLNDHARRHQLAAVWTESSLNDLARHGVPLDRFILLTDCGELIACGALWDQRAFRQTVIRAYDPFLNAVRPFANLVNRVKGLPLLPTPGRVLAHAFLSPLAFVPGVEAMLPDFVQACFPFARQAGVEFLTLGLPATDARIPAMKHRFSARFWQSRLYQVNWSGRQPLILDENRLPFLPDIGLL